MSTPDKISIRKSMRARREALDRREVRALSQQAIAHLLRVLAMRRVRRIGIYLPFRNELDPTLLLRQKKTIKSWYVPVIMRLRFEALRFAPISTEGKWRKNRFGIAEPVVPRSRLRRARQLDILLLPLVAFDAAGNRLGFGAGFYDRTLAYMRTCRHWVKPRLVGLAYEFQRCASLPSDPWDIPLHAVVTEKGWQRL